MKKNVKKSIAGILAALSVMTTAAAQLPAYAACLNTDTEIVSEAPEESTAAGSEAPETTEASDADAEQQAQLEAELDALLQESLEGKSTDELLTIWENLQKNDVSALPNADKYEALIAGKPAKSTYEVIRGKVMGMLNASCKGGMKSIAKGYMKDYCGFADGPINLLTDMIFPTEKDASNKDIMQKIDDQTQEIITTLRKQTDEIVKKVTDYNVATNYGSRITDFDASAQCAYAKDISDAMKRCSNYNDKIVEVAYLLGNLNNYNRQDIVIKKNNAGILFADQYVNVDGEGGRNFFEVAYSRGASDAVFLNEAIAKSAPFLMRRVYSYIQDCLILNELLAAQEKVSTLTAEEVEALSPTAKIKYNELMALDGASQAFSRKADIMIELFGENGLVNRMEEYLNRADITEGITYIGENNSKNILLDSHVKLYNRSRYEAGECTFITQTADVNDGTFKSDLTASGLTTADITTIGKHIYDMKITPREFLTSIGFEGVEGSTIMASNAFRDKLSDSITWDSTVFHGGIQGYDINSVSNKAKFNICDFVPVRTLFFLSGYYSIFNNDINFNVMLFQPK